jgi:hypothetical protein
VSILFFDEKTEESKEENEEYDIGVAEDRCH